MTKLADINELEKALEMSRDNAMKLAFSFHEGYAALKYGRHAQAYSFYADANTEYQQWLGLLDANNWNVLCEDAKKHNPFKD